MAGNRPRYRDSEGSLFRFLEFMLINPGDGLHGRNLPALTETALCWTEGRSVLPEAGP